MTWRTIWTPPGHFAPSDFPPPPTVCIDQGEGGCDGPMGRRGYCRRHAKRAYRLGKLQPLALEERFWSKVQVNEATECWEWTGHRHPGGYGRIAIDGHHVPSHRLAYEWLVGQIPDGLFIDHLCRNPPCVNPDHLEPVTPRENVMRGIKGEVQRTGKCGRGHRVEIGRANCRECDALRATQLRRRRGIKERGAAE